MLFYSKPIFEKEFGILLGRITGHRGNAARPSRARAHGGLGGAATTRRRPPGFRRQRWSRRVPVLSGGDGIRGKLDAGESPPCGDPIPLLSSPPSEGSGGGGYISGFPDVILALGEIIALRSLHHGRCLASRSSPPGGATSGAPSLSISTLSTAGSSPPMIKDTVMDCAGK